MRLPAYSRIRINVVVTLRYLTIGIPRNIYGQEFGTEHTQRKKKTDKVVLTGYKI